jgi:hypothetical protein
MKNDGESHIHTPDSWSRSIASLALDRARATGELKPGGPPVNVPSDLTVQVAADCHRFCIIIGGTKMCFCL